MIDWTPELVARLGTAPDTEIAEQLGLTPSTVTRQRHRRGIEPFRTKQSGRYLWDSPENVAMLGSFTDKEIARKLGVRVASVQAARARRGIAALAPRKVATSRGTAISRWRTRLNLSISEAARLLGVGISTYQAIEQGSTFDGRQRNPSRAIKLACAAIENGLNEIE